MNVFIHLFLQQTKAHVDMFVSSVSAHSFGSSPRQRLCFQAAAGQQAAGQPRHNAAERSVHPEHTAPYAVCADSRRAHGVLYVKFAVALPK